MTKLAVAFAALTVAAGGVAAAGPIDDICFKSGGTDAACACATGEVTTTLASEDLALYEEAADAYLLRSAAGLSDEEAWDAAVTQASAVTGVPEAEAYSRVQFAGVLHLDAIRACR